MRLNKFYLFAVHIGFWNVQYSLSLNFSKSFAKKNSLSSFNFFSKAFKPFLRFRIFHISLSACDFQGDLFFFYSFTYKKDPTRLYCHYCPRFSFDHCKTQTYASFKCHFDANQPGLNGAIMSTKPNHLFLLKACSECFLRLFRRWKAFIAGLKL